MKRTAIGTAFSLLLATASACSDAEQPERGEGPPMSLLEERAGFATSLLRSDRSARPLDVPPPEFFSLVEFSAPLGANQAYLSRAPRPGQKSPAMLWISGGFPPGGMDASAWQEAPPDNDQSAKAYRLTGMVMMYPTLRGSFGNPGAQEGFFGEVDDVLAAADFLAQVDYVDPERIYLGGHSTGATLALLVAAASDRFGAVIAFGPVEDPAYYGAGNVPYDIDDARERRLRAPLHFLASIRSPTFVIEGDAGGNVDALTELARVNRNDLVHFLPIPGATHFDLLAPLNERIAIKIAALGERDQLELSQRELISAFRN